MGQGRRTYWLLALAGLILAAGACRGAAASPPAGTVPLTPTRPLTRTPTATETASSTPTIAPAQAMQPSPTAEPSRTPVPAVETPAPTPVPATAGPLPYSPTPSGQAVIHTFRALAADGTELTIADPGDTITLAWTWSGGTEATIYHMFGYQLSEPHWDISPTGSLTYTISPRARNRDHFVLFVNDAQGGGAQATLEIELRCPDEWFFKPAPDICPAGPALVSSGAEQHFERGLMLWSQAEDRVYVLFADGRSPEWQAYEDLFDEGEDPAFDPRIEPPAGLHQPVRGFGRIWREERGVRERLGWAVDTESGYETAIQRTSYVKYNDTYIRALDGGVWRLGPEHSEWGPVPSAEGR